MTPVDQTEFWTGEPGSWGNCESAVIASLLDLPLTDVPHFLREAKGDPVAFWEGINDFLESKGFVYRHYLWDEIDWTEAAKECDVYHCLAGPSPRAPGKIWHAVVGKNGQVVHDPHISKAGLYGNPMGNNNDEFFPNKWRVAFIEPIDNIKEWPRVKHA